MAGIFPATTTDDHDAFAGLVGEYTAWLRLRLAGEAWFMDAVLQHQSLDRELEQLATVYAPPRGGILLARSGGEIAGGVAYHELSADICEMKRMFIRDRFRSRGLGRELCRAIVAAARGRGYRSMRLDTSRRLTEAITMYTSFGFRECPPYRDYAENLIPHLLFMEMPLDGR